MALAYPPGPCQWAKQGFRMRPPHTSPSELVLVCCWAMLLGACDRDTPRAAPDRSTVAQAPSAALTLPKPDFSANSAAVHRVGQAAKAPSYRMQVEKVQECEVEQYFRPKAGNIKLGVDVTIAATGESVPVNPFYAKLVDAEGTVYTTTLAGCRPTLKSSRLEQDETASGFITFELPSTATGLRMTYAPFIIGGSEQRLVFDLGR